MRPEIVTAAFDLIKFPRKVDNTLYSQSIQLLRMSFEEMQKI